jgi:hypothetical protein
MARKHRGPARGRQHARRPPAFTLRAAAGVIRRDSGWNVGCFRAQRRCSNARFLVLLLAPFALAAALVFALPGSSSRSSQQPQPQQRSRAAARGIRTIARRSSI